jgi:hypothetical protein
MKFSGIWIYIVLVYSGCQSVVSCLLDCLQVYIHTTRSWRYRVHLQFEEIGDRVHLQLEEIAKEIGLLNHTIWWHQHIWLQYLCISDASSSSGSSSTYPKPAGHDEPAP